MGADNDLLAGFYAGGSAQNQMEGIFGVDSKAADLGAVHVQGPRDVPSFLAIAIKGEGDEVGSGELDRVPLEDYRGLGGIAAAEDGRARFGCAEA